MRVAEIRIGARVVTPLGRVARVEAFVHSANDPFRRVNLKYHDHQEDSVILQPKELQPYTGDAIVFRDEVERLRLKHGDVPLPPPLPRTALDGKAGR